MGVEGMCTVEVEDEDDADEDDADEEGASSSCRTEVEKPRGALRAEAVGAERRRAAASEVRRGEAMASASSGVTWYGQKRSGGMARQGHFGNRRSRPIELLKGDVSII